MPQAKSGKLKALVITLPKRTPAPPDMPTVAESGVPGYELTNAYGFLAPAGTPAAIVAAINRQANDVVHAPEFRARLAADGTEAAAPNTPAQYREAVSREIARLEKFFRTPGISPDLFR